MTRTALGTALSGLLALASFSAAAFEAPGWRVDAAASFVTFDGSDSTDPSLGNNFIDDSAVGVKLSAQYQFFDWLGLEGAYHATGNLKDQSTSAEFPGDLKISFQGLSLQALGYIPIPVDDLRIYLKAGYYDFDDDLSVNGTTTSTSSETGFVGGGGVVINIAEHFAIRADGEWFDMEVGDLWAVNVGFEYAFGGRETPRTEPAAPADAAGDTAE